MATAVRESPREIISRLRLPWEQFNREWRWRQGEHVMLIGATRSGKTTLETTILNRREYVVFLSTKRVDSTQDKLEKQGYKVIHSYAELHPDITPKAIFRPVWSDKLDIKQLRARHAEQFGELLLYVFRTGSWTVVMDETRYITDTLGLQDEAEVLWMQGRSLGVTLVAGTQRPRYIPLDAYENSDHLFLWRETDRDNLDRVAGLAGINRELVVEVVPHLKEHEFLYIYRYGDAAVSKVNLQRGK